MNIMPNDPARRARRVQMDIAVIGCLLCVLAVFLVRSRLFGWRS